MKTTSWRKASRSSGNNNSDCVELRRDGENFQVRDSKLDGESPIFEFSAQDLKSLLGVAR
jgi:hypothetical protein